MACASCNIGRYGRGRATKNEKHEKNFVVALAGIPKLTQVKTGTHQPTGVAGEGKRKKSNGMIPIKLQAVTRRRKHDFRDPISTRTALRVKGGN